MQGNARYAQESDQCKWTKVDGISMIFIRDYIPWNKQTKVKVLPYLCTSGSKQPSIWAFQLPDKPKGVLELQDVKLKTFRCLTIYFT